MCHRQTGLLTFIPCSIEVVIGTKILLYAGYAAGT
jgi:hypothetical protein